MNFINFKKNNAAFKRRAGERYISEEELRVSEDKFYAAFHASPNLMAITRLSDGMIIDVNEAYSELLGYTRAESLNRTTAKLAIWADPGDREIFVKNLNKFGVVTDFETVLRRKDGALVHVLDSARVILLKNEKFILSVAHDITERKRAEGEIAIINRGLQMLSDTNQALIHIKDESALLTEVCRIIVEAGGYRLAWVGFAEHDKEKTIRPVANAGFDSGYIRKAQLTWANTPRGRGPGGTAVRTGKPFIARDIAKNPAMAPWRADALKRGYRSIIALPLIADSQTLGVLGVYSRQVDAFNGQETKLLQELAADLAFGISTLRLDLERRSLEAELMRVSADKYKMLFWASRDAIMTLEPPSWRFTSANPATLRMFQAKSEKQFVSYEPWRLSPPRQIDGQSSITKAQKMIEKAMKEETNFFEWTHRRLNGEEFPAEVLLSKVKSDGVAFLQASVRDITERKKIEKKLEEYAEERFKAIFDNSSDGIVLADAKTKKFDLVNKSICRMLGYSMNELTKMSISDIHPAEDLPNVLKQFDLQLKGKIVLASNIPCQRKDGSIFYVDINASRVSFGGKQYMMGIFRDITERISIENKLKKEKEKLQQYLDVADVMLVVVDRKSRVVSINKRGCELLGYDEKDIVGRDWFDNFIPLRDRNKTKEAFSKLMKGNRAGNGRFENAILTSSGAERIISWHNKLIKSEDGRSLMSLSSGEDITEHKAYENLIRQSEIKYSTLVEKSNDAVLVIQDGVYKFANKSSEDITGYKAKEVLGKPLLDFVAPKYKKMVLDINTRRMMGEPVPSRYEFDVVKKGGSLLPIEVSSSIVEYEGRPAVMAIIRDMSKAKEIDRIKSEFIAVASHQLRTPLTGIKWFSQLLLADKNLKLNDIQVDYLKSINESNERMIKLVNDLLDVSHIETGRKFSVVKKNDDVISIIKRVINDHEVSTRAGNIKIDLAPQTPARLVLPIDEKKIEQVFLNLISNSIKYSGRGKTIIISAGKTGHEARFSVKDFGLGIPKHQQHRVFEKFFRADNIATVSQEGTGLGLYIVKNIIEGHGGKIGFESKENKGTTFYFTLPLK